MGWWRCWIFWRGDRAREKYDKDIQKKGDIGEGDEDSPDNIEDEDNDDSEDEEYEEEFEPDEDNDEW